MRILCIDPGKDSGWALFWQKQLVGCGLLKVSPENSTQYKVLADRQRSLDVCVVERPRIYPGRNQKASPIHIITLALMAGAAMGHCGLRAARQVYVEPKEWKGSRPKDVDNRRTISMLLPAELAIVNLSKTPKSKLNNVLDAIGIGLWFTRRKRNAHT